MVSAISANNPLSFSAFGQGEGNSRVVKFSPTAHILRGDRYALLNGMYSYYKCTQHDSKQFDFDGRSISTNPRVGTPVMTGAQQPSFYVPLKMRRPHATYRLNKIIVDAFTNILFGEERYPRIKVDGNDDEQDYLRALNKVSKLPNKLIQARSYGGSMGTSCLSWAFVNGLPYVDVHNPQNVYIHEWEDRTQLIPRHATEVYLYARNRWDGKKIARVYYWFRRDWLPDADIVFKPAPYVPNEDPEWEVDPEKIHEHKDGEPHFVWIQNQPSEEIDGSPDCDGELYEAFDAVDMLFSVVTRGSTLNLDPTLVLKMDPEIVRRMGVSKGTDNALTVGLNGAAEYLELGGQSIEAGLKLLNFLRMAILEAAQCVIPDPNQIAAQGVSAVALKALYAPMLAKSGIHRDQYGEGIKRVLQQMVRSARKNSKVVVDPETKEKTMAVLNLPPRIEKTPVIDELTGKPTGEVIVKRIPRTPGEEGGDLELKWPPYFLPTHDDQAKVVQNLSTATGGKSFMSRETAIDIASDMFGVDAATEQDRIAAQSHADKAAEMEMTPGIGGKVTDETDLPDGALPKKQREPIEVVDTQTDKEEEVTDGVG